MCRVKPAGLAVLQRHLRSDENGAIPRQGPRGIENTGGVAAVDSAGLWRDARCVYGTRSRKVTRAMAHENAAFDPLSLPESNATSYPGPFRALNHTRWNRRVGDHAGLKNFGVNLTRVVPGGQSSSRHWHSLQDEFVYVVSGELILQTDSGEEKLTAGMCAGFPAGTRDGHRFVNRSDTDAVLLVVGDRTPGDEIGYPDIDRHLPAVAGGPRRYTHKDGTPYD